MGNKGEIILTGCSSDNSLVNRFSSFFMRKADEVRDTIDADDSFMSEIP